MALTNAEKQKRWRQKTIALAKRAAALEYERGGCIFCMWAESDLKEDGHIVIKKNDHLVCDDCIANLSDSLAKAKAKASRQRIREPQS